MPERARGSVTGKLAWYEKERRGEAIRAALKAKATREEQNCKMKATKAKQREGMLSKLDPDEREKHERYLARKRAERERRKTKAGSAPGSLRRDGNKPTVSRGAVEEMEPGEAAHQ